MSIAPVAPLSETPLPGDLPSPLELVRRLHALGEPALSLAEFTAAAWPTVESAALKWNFHMDAICDHVQAVLERGRFGKAKVQKLLINVPPGTSKSLILNVFAPAWLWLWAPQRRLICASANPRIVLRDSVKCRDLITSDWYQNTFQPKWKLADDQNAKGSWKNTRGGWRVSFGAGSSSITGEHADDILLDDLLDAAEAHSKNARESIANWLDQAAGNRLNDLSVDCLIMIMQRLHEEDPSGHVIAKGDWEHLTIPMEYEVAPGIRCKCPSCTRGKTFIGWTDPRTEEGELLFAARFSAEVLAAERLRLGSYGYSGQMQQRPAPAAGGLFRNAWWRFWTRDKVPHPRPMGATAVEARHIPTTQRWESMVQSWDLSFKALDTSDFVCGLVMAKIGADKFILDVFWERADFTRTLDAIKQKRRDWPLARTILIEDKANGSAVINVLSRQLTGVVAIEPEGGKEARAASAVPTVEAGNVYLPEGAPWVDRWFAEFSTFPMGAHDDAVDALSQGLLRLAGSEDAFRAAALLGLR